MAATKEKYRTFGNVFDNFTIRNLFKLNSQNYFSDETLSPVSIGKESNVFYALDEKHSPVIIKIYRLEACDFNRMYDYIKLDTRYTRLKKRKRDIIFSWTQREYRNLLKAREAGVTVPLIMKIMHNILVMEFIGDKRSKKVSPRLKDCFPEDPADFLKRIVTNMKKLYKANLVHADLSSFNILNHNEKPVFIDFSQSTTLENPRADEFLERDIKNIVNFFSKLGLTIEVEEIKKQIISS